MRRFTTKAILLFAVFSLLPAVFPRDSPARTLVAREQTWRYAKGTAEASEPRENWRRFNFDDSGWSAGQAPIGYGEPTVNKTLSDMSGNYSSVFLRKKFTVQADDVTEEIRLRAGVHYDDGYIIWLNGEQVGDKNEPDGEPLHDSLAVVSREDAGYETNDLGKARGVLEIGENVIAVQLFNGALGSGDCKIDVELSTYKKVADTTFSADRGFFESPFDVTIRTATPGATVRYTTDGSRPTATNGAGTGPTEVLTVSGTTCLRARAFHDGAGYEPTDIDTHTYIFLADVLAQTQPAGYPSIWAGPTQTNTADYAMDSWVVGRHGGADWSNAFRAIPTMSLVTDQDDMFGTAPEGVYAESRKDERQERPVSVELIYPRPQFDTDCKGFQADCGIQAHGANFTKAALRLVFKREWGASRLKYPLFETEPMHADSAADSFDRIVLRSAANDCWPGSVSMDPATYTLTRDQWGRSSQLAMTGDGVRGIFVHLYINGMYWGIYNPVERPDHAFTSTYFGGEKEHWFATNHGYQQDEPPLNPDSGDQVWFDDLMLNSGSMSYSQLAAHLDVEQFSDYILLAWYDGNGDWANNNWYIGHPMSPDGPCRFFTWDVEKTWYNMPAQSTFEGGWVHNQFARNGSYQKLAAMWQGAFKKADFRMVFADRIYKHCFNGGALVDANSLARWNVLSNLMDKVVICESARWGDIKDDLAAGSDVNGDYVRDGDGTYPTYTREEHWRPAMKRIAQIMDGNVAQFVQACRTTTIQSSGKYSYPLIDPPDFHQHGGSIGAGFRLTMANPNGSGTIFYKTDGTDPRALGGSVASGAQNYNTAGAPALARTRHVKARVYKSTSTWSALRAATYNYTAHYPLIRVTEIHYNPLGGGAYEFVEIKNVSGTTTVGLSEMTFEKGIRYTFAPGATLGPGKYAVLVRNAEVFARRHPGVSGSSDVEIFGQYRGGLDNSGERLKLVDTGGATVFSVKYNDKAPWPTKADGDGPSLVYIGSDDDQDAPEKWRQSNLIDGSPGAEDGALYQVIVNEALSHSDEAIGELDALELYNAGDTTADIGGWYLSDSDWDYKKYQIPAGTTIPAGGYRVLTEADFNTPTNDPDSFAFWSHGDDVILSRWDGDRLVYIDKEDFGAAPTSVAFGRWVRSDGDAKFVLQSGTNTLGGPNAYPYVGSVILNELMYHATNGGVYDWIELYNRTGSTQPLYNGTNGWRLAGTTYEFPAGTTLAPYEYVLVTRTNETAFRAAYPGVPGGTRFFGPIDGVLENNGESLELKRPDELEEGHLSWIMEDRVQYNDNSPWPESPDGRGPSLERIAAGLYGNDPANWAPSLGAGGTPGAANSGMLVGKTAGWKYYDKGKDLGSAWRAPDYDDSGWKDGNAPLGYPDTNLDIDTEMDWGVDPSGKYTTTYFRTCFMLGDAPSSISSLTLNIRYDDGYVVWLNGQAVASAGLDPATVTHHTLASTSGSGSSYVQTDITTHKSALVYGPGQLNVLAVEIHQNSGSSSDIFMDAELRYQTEAPTDPLIAVSRSSIEVTCVQGQNAGSETFDVWNSGAGTLLHQVVESSSLLSVAPTTGTSDGSSDKETHTITFSTSGLAVGVYDRTVIVEDNGSGAVNSPVTVNVQITVSEPPPPTPGGLTAQSLGTTEIRLGWNDVDGETTYKIRRSADGVDWYALSAVFPAADATAWTDTGLAAGITRYYKIRAENAAGSSAYSAPVSASTDPLMPQIALSTTSIAVSCLEGEDAADATFQVWNDGTGTLQYNVAESTSKFSIAPTTGSSTGSGDKTTHTIDFATATLAPGNYDRSFTVEDNGSGAVNGPITVNVQITVEPLAPAVPSGLTATPLSGSEIRLSWYDVAFETQYKIRRSADGVDWYALSEVMLPPDTTSWTDTGLTAGTTRYYKMKAWGEHGNSDYCAPVSATTGGEAPVVMFTAYNDLAWQSGQSSANITTLTVEQNGTLVDYDTGNATAVGLSVIGETQAAQLRADRGAVPAAGTDADAVFAGKLDCVGLLQGGAIDLVLTFTGLDPALSYELVLFGNRDNVGYADRVTRCAVSDVDAFINASSCGSDYRGSQDAGAELANGYNTVNGYVARFVAVRVGSDGDAKVTVSSAAGTYYVNALMLRGYAAGGADTDLDWLPDDWEQAALSGTGGAAGDDGDGDGVVNYDEFVAGTDPDAVGDYMKVDYAFSGGSVQVSFQTIQATGTGYDGLSRYYALEKTVSGALDAWSAVPGCERILGAGQVVSYTAPADGAAYYRARVWLE